MGQQLCPVWPKASVVPLVIKHQEPEVEAKLGMEACPRNGSPPAQIRLQMACNNTSEGILARGLAAPRRGCVAMSTASRLATRRSLSRFRVTLSRGLSREHPLWPFPLSHAPPQPKQNCWVQRQVIWLQPDVSWMSEQHRGQAWTRLSIAQEARSGSASKRSKRFE